MRVCVCMCVCNACVYVYVYECENKASETYRNFNINSKEKASLLILKLTIHPPSGVIYHVHQYLQTRFLPIFHPLFFSLTSSTKLSTKSASDDYESLTIRDRLSSRRYQVVVKMAIIGEPRMNVESAGDYCLLQLHLLGI